MLEIAHVYVNRSHGGLAVPSNLALLCVKCHMAFDNGRKIHGERVKYELYEYMNKLYGEVDKKEITFNKWNTKSI